MAYPGAARCASMDVMVTMLPPRPPAAMRSAAFWVASTTQVKLVRTRASRPLALTSVNAARNVPPTTLTRMSSREKRSSQESKNPASASVSRTSTTASSTSTPYWRACAEVRASASPSTSASARETPARARSSALARPRPPPPPATTATLPASSARSSRNDTDRLSRGGSGARRPVAARSAELGADDRHERHHLAGVATEVVGEREGPSVVDLALRSGLAPHGGDGSPVLTENQKGW